MSWTVDFGVVGFNWRGISLGEVVGKFEGVLFFPLIGDKVEPRQFSTGESCELSISLFCFSGER